MQKNHVYNIELHSTWRFIVFFTCMLIGMNILLKEYGLNSEVHIFIFIVEFIATLFIAIFIARYLSSAKAELVLSKDSFEHNWISTFLFSNEESYKIPWNAVNNYVFQKDKTFDSFELNIDGNKRYIFSRLNIISIEDDFIKFQKDLPIYISGAVNKSSLIKGKSISEGKTIYENISFKVTMVILTLIGLFAIIVNIGEPISLRSLASFGLIGSNLLFAWIKMYTSKKK